VTASSDNPARVWEIAPPSASCPAWLLDLATAVCGEVLSPRGVLEYTNRPLDQIRQTLSEQPSSDGWLILGRWFLADCTTRTISPFSQITVPEWIERRFNDRKMASLSELEQLAMQTQDAVLLERVSHARLALQKAESARMQAQMLNSYAWISATSTREDLRSGRAAVALAERAAIATDRRDPAILDTLAAAWAEAGRFEEAVRVQREALGLLRDDKSKEDYGSRLKLYESNAPYRDATTNNPVTPAVTQDGVALLLQQRGWVCAQFEQWALAASDLTKAIALNPDDHYNWYLLAPLLLETGDPGDYRKHCHAMLVRFGATNAPPVAAQTAQACLLLPLDGADLSVASKLAETAVTVRKDDPGIVSYQLVKGLAEYREGRFQTAAEWVQKALEQPGTVPDYNRDAEAYSLLAMARHRLKKAGEAREALSKATDLAREKLPRLHSGDLGPNWYNWIIAQTLLREAKALIEGGSKAADQTK
jgi:tetratricopeptide (TPR) repeat protein